MQAGDETKWRIQVVRPHRLALGFTVSKRRPKRSTTVTDAVLTLTLCYNIFSIPSIFLALILRLPRQLTDAVLKLTSCYIMFPVPSMIFALILRLPHQLADAVLKLTCHITFPIPSIILALLLRLPPLRNSDPGRTEGAPPPSPVLTDAVLLT